MEEYLLRKRFVCLIQLLRSIKLTCKDKYEATATANFQTNYFMAAATIFAEEGLVSALPDLKKIAYFYGFESRYGTNSGVIRGLYL